jgi:O-antigen/teichoic acid export membrane protein
LNSAGQTKHRSIKGQILKGGVNLAAGQIFIQICSFVRNVIIARLVSPADFGIASMFAISLSLIEMISNLAAEKLIIQDFEGDSERFQATIHCLQFVRGCLIGLLLFSIAGPLARLFGVEDARWAFQWLGSIPFIRGLIHQDMIRLQRQMRFGPSILVEAGVSMVVTIAAYPLGIWLGDYSAMLWIIVAQAGIGTLGSHIVAERHYRWAFDKNTISRLLIFGWPLLINGLLMFGILQGDRFIIGAADRLFGRAIYSLTDLGVYSVAFSLVFAPTMLIANVSTALFLPLLSRVQDSGHSFERRYYFVCQTIALAGGLISIPLIISGEWIIHLIYGPKYANAGSVVAWLAAMQALRIIRIGPTLGAMAKGDTKNAMFSNIVRSIAFVGVVLTAAFGGSLPLIAASGFMGEVFAMGYCVGRLKNIHRIPVMVCLKPALISGIFMTLGAVAVSAFQMDKFISFNLSVSVVTVICFLCVIFYISKDFRNEIISFIGNKADFSKIHP